MGKPGIFVVFVVVIAACTAPPSSEGEGEGEGEDNVVDDETLRAYVEAECFFTGTCLRQDQFAPEAMSTCVDDNVGLYRNEEAAGRVLRADQMALCREQLLACDVELVGDAPCRRIVDGAVPLGGACRGLDCEFANICVRDGAGCGTCLAPPVVGDECAFTCAADAVCDRGQEPARCVVAPRRGDACVSGACGGGAGGDVCDGGVCVSQLRQVGDFCAQFCNGPKPTGLFCDDGVCAAAEVALPGESCIPFVNGSFESAVMCIEASQRHSVCRADGDSGICVAFVDAGDACDDVHSCGNSVCVDGVCVVTADGDACDDGDCGPSSFCDGVCTARGDVGASCVENRACTNRNCVDGVCTDRPVDTCVLPD